ncbi:MAG TPA: hypothetical protein PK223_04775, partial [Bacillota bacterium]|nr:hypothetical protein [Bacillota bacterium]
MFNKKRNADRKLTRPLAVWLAGILLGFVENQVYINEAIFVVKFSAYAYFLFHFFRTTYDLIIKKVNEADELIENMKDSFNKEVKKRVFEIERTNERL